MKKGQWIALAVVATLGLTQSWAEGPKEIGAMAVKKATQKAKENQVKIVQEAVEAVALTQKVLVDLSANDREKARKDLEKAIGKLEVVLAHQNAPSLLPIDSSISATEYMGTLASIRETLDEVKKLLVADRVQDARRLLNTLQSEIDIITINLPLISYPQALKLAAKYLGEKKTKEAKEVLEMALGTLVQNEIIIPLPILKAQAMIEAAGQINKKDKKEALDHLEKAREQLKIAEMLGYTSRSDTTYKILDEAITAIEKEIKGPNKAEELFKELIEKIKEFKEKAFKSIDSQKSRQ